MFHFYVSDQKLYEDAAKVGFTPLKSRIIIESRTSKRNNLINSEILAIVVFALILLLLNVSKKTNYK